MHIIQYLKQLQKKLTAKLRFEALKGILTHVPLERIFNQKNFCETEFQKKKDTHTKCLLHEMSQTEEGPSRLSL